MGLITSLGTVRPIVLIFVSRPVCLYFPSISFFLYPINVFILLLKVYVCPRDRTVASFKLSSGTIFSHMMHSRPINEENSLDERFWITTSRPRTSLPKSTRGLNKPDSMRRNDPTYMSPRSQKVRILSVNYHALAGDGIEHSHSSIAFSFCLHDSFSLSPHVFSCCNIQS